MLKFVSKRTFGEVVSFGVFLADHDCSYICINSYSHLSDCLMKVYHENSCDSILSCDFEIV